jgi:hypothetical protein
MRLHTYLVSLFLAGILLGSPSKVLANDNFPSSMNPETIAAAQEFPNNESFELISADPFEMAGVDYCYRGSITDPTTGEVVDLFVMCTEGEVGYNLNIA